MARSVTNIVPALQKLLSYAGAICDMLYLHSGGVFQTLTIFTQVLYYTGCTDIPRSQSSQQVSSL
jgi:hypothetical protein